METLRPIDKIASYCKIRNGRPFNPKITHEQLFRANRTHYYCWGTHNVTSIDDYALAFKVNGLKHQGWVAITLDFDDTYRVHLLNTNGEVKGSSTGGIYFDKLNEFVDSVVESGD